MILDVVPLNSPDLRPMVQLGGGRFISDLNDLYEELSTETTDLRKLLELGAPVIVRNERECFRNRLTL